MYALVFTIFHIIISIVGVMVNCSSLLLKRDIVLCYEYYILNGEFFPIIFLADIIIINKNIVLCVPYVWVLLIACKDLIS